MKTDSKPALHIFALITIVFWSLNYVLTRIAIRYFLPESLSFLRYLVASIALIIYAAIKKMGLPRVKDIPMFFLGGAIGFGVYGYVFNLGSKTVEVSVSSFIIGSSPVLMAVFARIFLKEKIGIAGWSSVICACMGVGIITLTNGGISLSAGVVWICLAAVLVSVYNIYQRKLLPKYSPLEITTYCIIAGTILLSVFAPKAFPQLLSAPAYQIATVVTAGIFPAAIAYLCWAYALSIAEKTSEVTNYMFLSPILTTFLGYIMIDETPGIYVYLGGGLIILSLLLINRHRQKKSD